MGLSILRPITQLLWAFRNPLWGVTWLWEFSWDRVDTLRHRRRMAQQFQFLTDVRNGLARITGAPDYEVLKVLAEPMPFIRRNGQRLDPVGEWGASDELAQVSYAVTRLLRPRIVVETGVGSGLSSWAILLAIALNEEGHLYSVDLPTPKSQSLPEIGYLVPQDLRRYWTVHLGPSRSVLPRLLRRVSKIDVFLHDSRHSYANQTMEYMTAWPHLRAGGVLISDDVGNDAFLEAAEDWKCTPVLIAQPKGAAIGSLAKPNDAL